MTLLRHPYDGPLSEIRIPPRVLSRVRRSARSEARRFARGVILACSVAVLLTFVACAYQWDGWRDLLEGLAIAAQCSIGALVAISLVWCAWAAVRRKR